ncbi:prefoldin subunit 3-like [Corticium candelabrum]|uniref:prefoldin subunit 3-like n=1 Tax=Corticium candelabrum TaxID=121492 RepID=UPI002E26AA0D|nr:prefoldin subunit 3-like [Corticium candelabrum]
MAERASESEAAAQPASQVEETDGTKPHRRIPAATFLDDIDAYMKDPANESAEAVLKRLDMLLQNYRLFEASLEHQRERSKDRPVSIRKTLEVVKHLRARKESGDNMRAQTLLADQLYVNATIPPTSTVCLWLGANVMLEYPIDEAQELLERNLVTATENLEDIQADLEFLRDQRVTTEVNMARIYNWNVRRKEAAKSS